MFPCSVVPYLMEIIKRGLGGLVFWTLLSSSSYADIRCDWSGVTVPKEKQQLIEECIQKGALKYTEKKYADMGELHFASAPEIYIIRIDKDQGQPEYWLGGNGGTLFLDVEELNDMTKCEIIVFHEFSHIYDWTLKDRADKEHSPIPKTAEERKKVYERRMMIKKNVEETESRAIKKEQQYVEEIKARVPEKLYKELQKRYSSS